MINNSLTAFLKSSQLIEFCWTHNKKHISEIHVDFVNINRISAMIYKTRLDYWSVTVLACVTRKVLGKEVLGHLGGVGQYYRWW